MMKSTPLSNFLKGFPLLTLSLMGALSGFPSLAHADVTVPIPYACGVCRRMNDEGQYFACLAQCMAPVFQSRAEAQEANYLGLSEPALIEAARRTATWAGWVFDGEKRFVSKRSQTRKDELNRPVYASLTLSPHHGQKGIRFQMTPYLFSPFRTPILVVLDSTQIWELQPNRYSDKRSAWAVEPNFLRALRRSQRMEVHITPLGEEAQTFVFDMDGVRSAMDAIWPQGL